MPRRSVSIPSNSSATSFHSFGPFRSASRNQRDTSLRKASQHLAEERSPQPLALVLTWGLAAAVAVGIGGWEAQRGGVPEAVGTSGGSARPAVGTLGDTASAAAPAAAVTDGVTISLEATGPSWVTAHVDGRRAIYRTLQPGERELLRARREIRIRTGDAGALRWQIDGRDATAMGQAGEVRTVRVTPADESIP
jgi:hypothetical protein